MAQTSTTEQQQRLSQINSLKTVANAEQKIVINYFTQSCFGPKDEKFDQVVSSLRSRLNTRQMALNKIGLDEDQLKEIPDICFEGFQTDTWNNGKIEGFSKAGADTRWRSGKYAITHLFFSPTQVYMYKYEFSLYSNDRKERTEEYFYRDITNFSTSDETVNAYNPNCIGGVKVVPVSTQRFELIVPGDRNEY
ncbi:MAG: hypothetical protein LBB50_02580 [Oscillospiraceae bacterium]|jgi:hypothetical protein|nr:hypothetical protein [Oscillospiraceae bacterium]